MTFHTDAIYEAGVLRPLTPLSLQEHQVVSLAISTSSEQARSLDQLVRDHSAFLNSYAPEDEGLYDDYSAG
ncbi:MAG: antitoxin family protein [Planctomycetes bacterium]|nr:antitoxin family protein [Planctomycetota bacterium]